MMNTKLNMDELIMITGGTGPLGSCDPVGWPNGWDVAQTGPLGSCDPVGWPNGWDVAQTGPLGTCDPPRTTGPLSYETGPLGYPY